MKKTVIMKRWFAAVLLLLMTAACGVHDTEYDWEGKAAEAKHYVDQLMTDFRDGTINTNICPPVMWEHIPYLLEYASSTTLVGKATTDVHATTIPSCPYTSFLMTQCLEGTFALWMVEAARIHTLYGENLSEKDYPFGWPSMNPFLQSTGKNGGEPEWHVNDVTVQKIAQSAYERWWSAGQGLRIGKVAPIDPLAKTRYSWH